ncbi:hypothetical protein DSO57_1023832 [Entomophthora muscae]|uniref:Uncharacterized protein n=1 Tax=Entomophthora muscae TaxID=34485 RepID=A0ACC2RHB3_9FUNG|nr:hypothetical protein DSO57_1023832 [Entomophthora muscae]
MDRPRCSPTLRVEEPASPISDLPPRAQPRPCPPSSVPSVPQADKPIRWCPASVRPQSPSSASDKDPVKDFFEVDEEPPANLPQTLSQSSTSSGDHCHPRALSGNPAPPPQRRQALKQTSSCTLFVSRIEPLPVPTAPPSYQSIPSAPPLPMHQVSHPGPSDDPTILDMEHVCQFLSKNGDILTSTA